MHQLSIRHLIMAVFLCTAAAGPVQAKNMPVPPGGPGGGTSSFCSNLPCSYTAGNGWSIDVVGNVSQNATSAVMDTTLYINGNLFGVLHIDVSLSDSNEIVLDGDLDRINGSIAGLPPLRLPFQITGPSPQVGSIPYLDADSALALTIIMNFLDMELVGLFQDTVLSGPPQCENRTREPLGCNGPMTGVTNPIPFLPPIPLPNSSDIEECCQKHDVCYTNGGEPECEDVCDDAFRECIEALTPWYSYPYTQLVLAFFAGHNPAFQGTGGPNDGGNEDCRCILDVNRYDLKLWQGAGYDEIVIEDKKCCEQEECEEIKCYWILNSGGEERWRWTAKCQKPPKPDGKGGCK